MKTFIVMSLLFVLTGCDADTATQEAAALTEQVDTKSLQNEKIKTKEKVEKTETLPEEKVLVSSIARPASVIAISEETNEVESSLPAEAPSSTGALKLTATSCVDPDLSQVLSGISLTLCDGSVGTGSMALPAPQTVTVYVDRDVIVTRDVIVDNTVVIAPCTANGQTDCVTNVNFKSANLSNLNASNVKLGVDIAGTVGSYAPPAPVAGTAPADCNSNLQIGCVTTSTYKALDTSALSAGVIKSGVSVAGITGQYPSALYPLAGTSVADLDAATFFAKIKAAASFEWFDASGVRHEASGNELLTAANLKAGVQIFGETGSFTGTVVAPDAKDIRIGKVVNGVVGQLKPVCREAGYAGEVVPANEACVSTFVDKSTVGGAGNTCDTVNPVNCMFLDTATNLYWAPASASAMSFAQARTYCANLSYNGLTGWRLPSRNEMALAGASGLLWGNTNALRATYVTGNELMWTYTLGVNASNQSGQYMMNASGHMNIRNGALGNVNCVRPL